MMIGDKEGRPLERLSGEVLMREMAASSSIPTRILVPIDFSESSHAALITAADLAQHFHAELHLVHILPIFPRTTFPDFMPETTFLHKVRKAAEERFAACEADLGA
jgi:nucleotide-binding universal stress UspA family protein